MKRKKTILIILGAFFTVIFILGFVILNTQTQVKELFKMNKTLQAENYYMADFEFRIMSVLYYLDKGEYIKSLAILSDYHSKLSRKEELLRLPEFKNNQEEIDFYLNLQNPQTGAFIDEGAPFFIYWAITENTLEHLENLHDSTTLPLKLKYPLIFLDKINSPDKLKKHLNGLAYTGWLGPKFAMTSFVFVRGLMSCARNDNVLVRNNLYNFSAEWKHAFLKWMYEFQDAETGMWGPKDRSTKKLAVKDLDNTASLLKQFRDNNGNNLYEDFPLRYKEKLIKSTLDALKEPFPENDNLPNIHAWNLKTVKGIKMLLRYLWKDASAADKIKVQEIITHIIQLQFGKYYVKSEGAFSYYPNADHASVDGMTNFPFNDIGALSYKKQKKYWGDPLENSINLGLVSLIKKGDSALDFIDTMTNINSIRIYTVKPDFTSLTDSVWAVVYPRSTMVLDVMEIVPNIVAWTQTSSLSMGNWMSMAGIRQKYASLNISKPLIFKNGFPYSEVKSRLEESSEIYLIGFDILQIPRFLIGLKT